MEDQENYTHNDNSENSNDSGYDVPDIDTSTTFERSYIPDSDTLEK